MNILWPDKCLFYVLDNIFPLSSLSLTTFVKEVCGLETSIRLWRNEHFVTKWLHIFCFWYNFLTQQVKLKNFRKISFLINLSSVVWFNMVLYGMPYHGLVCYCITQFGSSCYGILVWEAMYKLWLNLVENWLRY